VANYPFCTIEPNVGVVPVPDPRLDALVALYHPKSVVAATVNFVDIAGLVRGASKGEGLGNQFLANIRETDAIAHVVRCFEDDNVIHVEGPRRSGRRRRDDRHRAVLEGSGDCRKAHRAREEGAQGPGAQGREADPGAMRTVEGGPRRGQAARAQGLTPDEQAALRDQGLLTLKKVFYVANVAEKQLGRATATSTSARCAPTPRPRARRSS
jgi:ribosome-binding ATPase YchF (GTP1/OBG family)